MMRSWWPKTPKPGNFGDILTPYIYKKLTGKELKYTHHSVLKRRDLLCVGSIIKFAKDNVNVWGSGIMSIEHEVNPRANYLAVRGPITRDKIIAAGGKCPEVYGDPALLLPMFYNPKPKKQYNYGIIPHYVDYESVREQMKGSNANVINVLGSDIEKFIDEVLKCDRIISSSLHGLIAAHAYGIDAVWAKFSDKLNGDGSKFKDYFQSVGIEMSCIDLSKGLSLQDLIEARYTSPGKIDNMKLLESFPYPFNPTWRMICEETFVY